MDKLGEKSGIKFRPAGSDSYPSLSPKGVFFYRRNPV